MQQVTPKKRLGQHFLKDRNIAGNIVGAIKNNELPILEVGPGTGVLTSILIENEKNFVALDVDRESIDYLKANYPDYESKFLLSDFLREDIGGYFNEEFLVLGNFPYNISSQLFFKILEYKHRVSEVVCMIQKEVAERICTGPGSKAYGILSVFLQAYYTAEYLFTVPENVFIPPPKVKSGVMRLVRNDCQKLDCDEKLFFRVVKAGFNQRRKTLRNSLKEFDLQDVSTDVLSLRPEQLSVDEFVYITQNVKMK